MKPTLWIAVTILLLSFWLPASGQSSLPGTTQPWSPALTGLLAQPASGVSLPPISAITPAGQLGGSTQAVAVQGSLAYIGTGPRMLVLDVTDPAAPVQLGQTPPLASLVKGIAVVDNLAYVAAEYAGLRVFDVSDPAEPIEISAYDTPG